MKIIAVVVTFNRLPYLQHNIACLRQIDELSAIFVVNNGSTDATREWLDAQTDLHVFHQSNVGGSGGFHRGIDEAARCAPDWIWCMDDDVYPRPDCLHHLLAHADKAEAGMLIPRRLKEGKTFHTEFTGYNLSNPFCSMYTGKLAKHSPTQPTPLAGAAFEGPLIRIDVVRTIGLPNRELFIFCDDTDYCLRTLQAGFTIWYIPDALMDKEPFFQTATWSERQIKKKWKRYYQIRNAAYLNRTYGANRAVRYGRSLISVCGYILTAALTAPFARGYRWRDIPMLWQAYCDGIHGRLGKREFI